jgi:3-oxoacyl-[acyl-carrier-protein] synthase-3
MKSLQGVTIKGISTAVPTQISKIEDYGILSEKERAKFSATTGIYQRHIVEHGQCASDLCISAANDLLSKLEWEKDTIEALIMITQSGDHPIPATSIIIQHKLGLTNSCAAFDINLGCSSYPYGLAIAGSFMKTLNIQRAILLVGDVSSKSCPYDDKSSWPLFGDAGSATALEIDENAPPMFFDFNTDGSGWESIFIKSGGLASRNPPSNSSLTFGDFNLKLNGTDIFSFAVNAVPKSITKCLSIAEWEIKNIDFFILHQANKMINDTIQRKVGFNDHRALSSLKEYGNTSSVSIPLTLCAEKLLFKGGEKIILSGFGVGLSWATCALNLPKQLTLNLFESDNVY